MQDLQKWERIYAKARGDGISPLFLAFKKGENGELDYTKGAMKHKAHLEKAVADGKNALILGKTGTGKSFLAFEVAFGFKSRLNGDLRIYYSRASVLCGEFRGNFKNISKTLDDIFTKESYYYNEPRQPVQLVIIDEIDDLQGDEWQIINEVICTAYDNMTPLVLLGNLDTQRLKNELSAKALSRLLQKTIFIDACGKDLRTNEEVQNDSKKD